MGNFIEFFRFVVSGWGPFLGFVVLSVLLVFAIAIVFAGLSEVAARFGIFLSRNKLAREIMQAKAAARGQFRPWARPELFFVWHTHSFEAPPLDMRVGGALICSIVSASDKLDIYSIFNTSGVIFDKEKHFLSIPEAQAYAEKAFSDWFANLAETAYS
jgi:hypothetical protein